jgi:4-hydroxy-tetrahydrodipicolinate synthase
MPIEPFATVTAAIATPFRADLSVDFERLARHAHWLLGNGCDGLVLFGTTGEAASLNSAERKEILVQLISAGIPAGRLLVGTGCCAISETVDLTLHAARANAAGALILPPYFFKGVSEEGIAGYYDAVIAACGADVPPIYLYHIPHVTSAPVGPSVVARLIERHGQKIRGYKDSSGVWENTAEIIRRFAGLHVYIASEARLLDHLNAGGVGCISASVNVQPAAVRRLVEGSRGENAAKLQSDVLACRKVLESGATLIPNVKAALAEIHGDGSWAHLRPPLETPAAGARMQLLAQLRALRLESL